MFPKIGAKLIYDVTRADVMAILEPIWTVKPRIASDLRTRLDVILGYAVANGFRLDNPVVEVVKGLPKRRGEKRHHEAMAHTEVPGFLRDLREFTATGLVTRLALEFNSHQPKSPPLSPARKAPWDMTPGGPPGHSAHGYRQAYEGTQWPLRSSSYPVLSPLGIR